MPWTDRQTITGLTHRDRQPFTLTFTSMDNLESPINLHVFGMWEEAGVPRENPHWHRENMQTLHMRAPPPFGVKKKTKQGNKRQFKGNKDSRKIRKDSLIKVCFKKGLTQPTWFPWAHCSRALGPWLQTLCPLTFSARPLEQTKDLCPRISKYLPVCTVLRGQWYRWERDEG